MTSSTLGTHKVSSGRQIFDVPLLLQSNDLPVNLGSVMSRVDSRRCCKQLPHPLTVNKTLCERYAAKHLQDHRMDWVWSLVQFTSFQYNFPQSDIQLVKRPKSALAAISRPSFCDPRAELSILEEMRPRHISPSPARFRSINTGLY